ncbi:MAG: DUF4279 domain-containing protein [Deltaproteobacteria bacterium]|nr:DUF4279 domain-containing protein [Deltaproteobacteria bacterium]
MKNYDDEYATCAATYATLRVYPGALDPDVVTRRLGLEPSDIQHAGEQGASQRAHGRGATPPIRTAARPNGWFLSSERQVVSRDCRRHIDWLVDRVMGRREELLALRQGGARMDVSCFWASRGGHGGPSLLPQQMAALCALDLEIWFDCYWWPAEQT